jgi:glycosyltransferase involved in cell wall biosynthesis
MTDPVSKLWKLVAVETHPIQYKAPLFRRIANDPRFDLTVLYAMIPDSSQQGDGFGVAFSWDVPLLDGYRYEVLENRATHPSVSRFRGCDTPGIYAWLKKNRPDAVLVNGWVVKTCLQTLLSCRRLGIPCVVRGEANLLRPRAWWKHLIHRLLLPNYSAYLAIGSASRDFYRFHGRPEDRIFFAPYAVDNDCFSAQAETRRSTRAELRSGFGIQSEAVTFLFVGKLEEKKHPLDLLRAAAKIPVNERSKMHLLFAGDGPLMEMCRQFVAEHQLPVTFAGFVNQSHLPDVYAAADVLVLPSDAGETWGLVVNEAMASGRPAIVSHSAGCCQDLIVEGETGFSFSAGDVNVLAEHLRLYILEPSLAVRQGENANKYIRQFSFFQIMDGLASAVAAVKKKKRRDWKRGARQPRTEGRSEC